MLTRLRSYLTQGTPEELARGAALGGFLGMLPIIGQMLLAILLARLLGAHTPTALATVWISNPYTFVPIFTLNYYIGHLLLGTAVGAVEPVRVSDLPLVIDGRFPSWEQITSILTPLWIGSLLLASLVAVVLYIGVHALVPRTRIADDA